LGLSAPALLIPRTCSPAISSNLSARSRRLIDVPCYDHVILAGARYVSFAEAGLL